MQLSYYTEQYLKLWSSWSQATSWLKLLRFPYLQISLFKLIGPMPWYRNTQSQGRLRAVIHTAKYYLLSRFDHRFLWSSLIWAFVTAPSIKVWRLSELINFSSMTRSSQGCTSATKSLFVAHKNTLVQSPNLIDH